jgi:hypothetical protein
VSIISDALKKASHERRRTESAGGRRGVRPAYEDGKGRLWDSAVSVNSRPALLAGAALLVAGAALAYALLAARAPSGGAPASFGGVPGPLAAAGPAGSRTARSQFSVEEKPVFFGSESASFSLSGIAQFQDGYVAVVNGQILRRGDRVQGATVSAITSRAVELDYNGERIVLEKTF